MKDIQRKQFVRLSVFVVSALLVLAFLAMATPQTASAGACKFKYKVKAGDTLISVAQLYQTKWQEIVEANDLKEPYVLQVGQVLCIPNGTAPSDKDTPTDTGTDTSTTGKPVLSVTASFRHVGVRLENFPKNKVYYVRVNEPPQNVNGWKVGRLKTDKKGFFEGFFVLPDGFPFMKQVTLCLKDPFTDKTFCTGYENPYDELYYAAVFCNKAIR